MTRKFHFALMTLFLASFAGFSQQLQMPQASPSSKISQQFGLSVVTVDYSRPSAKGRKIFGELVPYGQIWRTGANSATQITFSTEVSISGQTVPAGTYALYAIPEKSQWTLILSKNTKLWGAIGYDPAEDQLRFQAATTKPSKKSETFEIGFNNITDNSLVTSIRWDNTQVDFQVETNVDPVVMAQIQKEVIDAKSSNPTLLFQAANYYFTTSKDLNQAYAWVKQSTEEEPQYWTMHLRAKIENTLGMKTEALDSANKSKSMAAEADNPDYVALNDRLIKSIK
ncbi:DUF2911 domain-containing protein [Algoriphagus sp. H41]|uniref:DUF2911 domain-containing protein n=1 Tax=Algoriphagus oliviformis TaxID=2811231 RepID=A0ABS3C7A2_9BACT|nr:DUF2911 domain-containing protein [Algoriphagus oliviformis]MBN7812026.1 DUF2911 domain-containing protein [Algoriphagus oliviformis]